SLRGAGASVEPDGAPRAEGMLPTWIAAPSESDVAIPKTFPCNPRLHLLVPTLHLASRKTFGTWVLPAVEPGPAHGVDSNSCRQGERQGVIAMKQVTRRGFLKRVAAVGVAAPLIVPRLSFASPPSSRLQH